MIYRTLGSTGERVSAIGVGGRHLSLKHVDEALSLRIVREAIDRGVNRRSLSGGLPNMWCTPGVEVERWRDGGHYAAAAR